jgi:NAD(P)H-dependent FMN reductase
LSSLMIIVGSTRPGRVGLPVAKWLYDMAVEKGRFERIDLADLDVIDLPFFDEPKHPRMRDYQHEHTKEWARRVEAADAFVIVTPEYNYGMPAPLKNAVDYLHHEWAYKPVAFASYGGMSGGTRAVQMLKQVMTAFHMFVAPEAVAIPFVNQVIEDGVLKPTDSMVRSGTAMLDELTKLADVLSPLREENRAKV